MPKIYIVDVTNRDGVQTSRIGAAKLQKTLLNVFLNEMGIFQSEFGFPFVRHEANYLNTNLDLWDKGVLKPMRLSGWCRAIPQDVELSFKYTNVKLINLSISTSDQMITHKFQGKLDRDSIISGMKEAAQAAREHGVEAVGVNAEDASRTDMDYLIRFAQAAKDAGADSVRYCDTLGYDDPKTIYKRINQLAKEVGIPIEVHCHNDLGMAVASSVEGAKGAIDAGVDAYINTCINGVGERAGNADLVSCILALKHSSGFKDLNLLDERVDLSKAWRLAKYASHVFDIPIPLNQPGVGANAFAHESGIHADGALKDRKNYELYDYEDLGRGEPEAVQTGRIITTGAYGGVKGFLKVYADLGIHFESPEQAQRILELVQYADLHTAKPLHEAELRFIAAFPEECAKIMAVQP
ncbi:MAG TPA: homocitrate synthase [Armatimonadota bacterium]|nr:homocitrate synthase [Armatimonadota bacterium]